MQEFEKELWEQFSNGITEYFIRWIKEEVL